MPRSRLCNRTHRLQILSNLSGLFTPIHNMFVIEKGDNTEPSNFDYHFNNIHSSHALRTIVDQLKQMPTAAGYANLIDLYVLARDLPAAWAAVDEALTR
jgi:hypothetical protein